MYNHKQRREMEKNLGLLKAYQKMSEKNKAEIREKKRQAGVQIHLRNLQEWENQRVQNEAEKEARILQGLIDSGKTPEEAHAIIKRNREIEEKRERELEERQAKAAQLARERKEIEEQKKAKKNIRRKN